MTESANNIPKGCPDSLLAGPYNEWIQDLFQRKATFDQQGLPRFAFSSSTAYYERHLYFVTMHFKPGLGAAPDSTSPIRNGYLFDSIYKGWYRSVCEKTLGPKYNKKPKLQPFCMAFLDVEGSRNGQAATAFQIPHIHALLMVHPTSADQFRKLYKPGVLTITADSRVSKIDIRPFVDQGQTAFPMMTYAAKYARQTAKSDRLDRTWANFPDVSKAVYPFYRHTDPSKMV